MICFDGLRDRSLEYFIYGMTKTRLNDIQTLGVSWARSKRERLPNSLGEILRARRYSYCPLKTEGVPGELIDMRETVGVSIKNSVEMTAFCSIARPVDRRNMFVSLRFTITRRYFVQNPMTDRSRSKLWRTCVQYSFVIRSNK